MNYRDQLRESARRRNSRICFGLDPDLASLPEKYREFGIAGFVGFLEEIFTEMADQKVYAGAIKPNFGYYDVHNTECRHHAYPGWDTLGKVLDLHWRHFPDDPQIGDWKLGDIAKSSTNYAKIYFENWKVSAGTVSPWMGSDSILPFAKFFKDGKGSYLLNCTSNEGKKDFQMVETTLGGNQRIMYGRVSEKIIEWAKDHPGLGAVVGATGLEQLAAIAKMFGPAEIPMLIPGVGAPGAGGQGGDAGEVAQTLVDNGYPLELALFNVSSALTHPWAAKKEQAPADFAKMIVANLHKYNEAINYKIAA